MGNPGYGVFVTLEFLNDNGPLGLQVVTVGEVFVLGKLVELSNHPSEVAKLKRVLNGVGQVLA